MIYVGTAGWTLPKDVGERFAGSGSHLERYARVLHGAEINSTFKHVHRPSTYARWATSTPPAFRFSVKLPHAITHERRLVASTDALDAFFSEIEPLAPRLGALLVQLPGTLQFEASIGRPFFAHLRRCFSGQVACEPRHPSWFEAEADALLVDFRINRVAADPARAASAGDPGGWQGNDGSAAAYFRWHGSPQIYRSAYSSERLAEFAAQAAAASRRGDCWCIFDNTAAGAAAADALSLVRLLAAA